jgi:hypothetical protein
MPTRLGSLGNDCVAAFGLEPARLVHRGGAGNDLRACRNDTGQQVSIWQPEMKADDLGPHLLDDPAKLLAERRAG